MIDKPPAEFEVSVKIVERLAKFHAANFFLDSDNVCGNCCLMEKSSTDSLIF